LTWFWAKSLILKIICSLLAQNKRRIYTGKILLSQEGVMIMNQDLENRMVIGDYYEDETYDDEEE